ncbi:hypothetical protein [uncultured Duncaniella sp.]|uniref:hypothetical protein n=2 Tax=uncultured Duncaniella sp. TaxID=2768039 RepID=UPI002649B447|nr:hypothetical protein [uncultured Duncaniella sp.]
MHKNMANPNTLPEWVEKYQTITSSRAIILHSAVEYLQEIGLTRLGFWGCEDMLRSSENKIQYSSEDEKIFSQLVPDFEIESPEGLYIGVLLDQDKPNEDESKMQVIIVPSFKDEVTIEPLNSYNYDEFCLILDAIVKSVEFNKANNIPVEKWGVMHDAFVNPYTLEYIG